MNNETLHPLRLLTRRDPSPVPRFNQIVIDLKEELNRAGFDASEKDIEWAWQRHSLDRGSVWLGRCASMSEAVLNIRKFLDEPK